MLTDLVARDLLTAALSRLVAPGSTTTILTMQVACRPDGRAMLVRDVEGRVLARLAVPSFIRSDTDAAPVLPGDLAPSDPLDEPSGPPVAMRG